MSDACRSCQAPIEWAKSARNGKAIPLDVEPRTDGNIVVLDGVAHVALAGDSADKPRRISHFATCTQADQWRRR